MTREQKIRNAINEVIDEFYESADRKDVEDGCPMDFLVFKEGFEPAESKSAIKAWLIEKFGMRVDYKPIVYEGRRVEGTANYEFPIVSFPTFKGLCCICWEEVCTASSNCTDHVLGPPLLWYDIRPYPMPMDIVCTLCRNRITEKGMSLREFWHEFRQPLWDFMQYGKRSGEKK